MIERLSFGFQNPNHAAAMLCAWLPVCFGWRRRGTVGSLLVFAVMTAIVLTQSRTGLLVAGVEAVAWWGLRKGGFHISGFKSHKPIMAGVVASVAIACWWMWPRLVLNGSVLNRPRIWLAGLRLFAANSNGVGLGNSGVIASAFLLDGIPEVRTMISAHITLLAEFGWIVGWAWFAFIGLALWGVRESPRVGVAFAGLALSACSSTIFDWAVLFDYAGQGGLGRVSVRPL